MQGSGFAGANLLVRALGLINTTPVDYYKYGGKEVLPNRVESAYYEPAVNITSGTVQAVNSARAAAMGVNVNRQVWNWWVNYAVDNVERGRMPDKAVIHTGAVCDVWATTPWGGLDGWTEVTLVETGEPVESIRTRAEVQP